MENREQDTIESLKSVAEDWQDKIVVPNTYNAHRNKFL